MDPKRGDPEKKKKRLLRDLKATRKEPSGDLLVGSPCLERLAEYGWKPHRFSLAQRGLSRASIYWYMHEQQRRTVSSNWRRQTVLFQQYSTNLSFSDPPLGDGAK